MKMKRPASSAASPQSRRYFSSVRRHQRSDHPFSVGYTAAAAEHFTRCRVRIPRMTVAGFLRLHFVTFMFWEPLFIAGARDRRLKRTSRLHANVTDIRRKRGIQFEPEPPLESILKAVCDPDGCGTERLEDWTAFTPTPSAPSDSAACYISYTVQVSYP